jgi:uncharacterized protein (TIGR00255 family)
VAAHAGEVAVLLSMTGYGEARYQSDEVNVSLELRALNNRYLKVTLRANEPYHLLEPEFEKVIRRTVRRGTIQVHLRFERRFSSQDFQINGVALQSYISQVLTVADRLELGHRADVLLAQVLVLPGVASEPGSAPLDLERDWPLMERVLVEGLERLQTMRQDEGQAMAHELLQLRDAIGRELEAIRARAPLVVTLYRDRLLERVRGLLAELDVELDRNDVIKEVSIFAERSDIAEEVVRLASHLGQFHDIVHEPESAGRKLEFLTQEMFRETNTIGSKASDVEISRHVVEIKGALEKIRELVQNIE